MSLRPLTRSRRAEWNSIISVELLIILTFGGEFFFLFLVYAQSSLVFWVFLAIFTFKSDGSFQSENEFKESKRTNQKKRLPQKKGLTGFLGETSAGVIGRKRGEMRDLDGGIGTEKGGL